MHVRRIQQGVACFSVIPQRDCALVHGCFINKIVYVALEFYKLDFYSFGSFDLNGFTFAHKALFEFFVSVFNTQNAGAAE